ncbi:putative hydro-lyase KRH_21160 [Panicum virgatum]|uniref:putative hydro-lyase KRH_21160 n=1 Tax=Panicum virgatum TaxID=38727 RepID=UPI0019D6452B|nr:putative hydro-lyase KRH_21160 [Panicum virgatum]
MGAECRQHMDLAWVATGAPAHAGRRRAQPSPAPAAVACSPRPGRPPPRSPRRSACTRRASPTARPARNHSSACRCYRPSAPVLGAATVPAPRPRRRREALRGSGVPGRRSCPAIMCRPLRVPAAPAAALGPPRARAGVGKEEAAAGRQGSGVGRRPPPNPAQPACDFGRSRARRGARARRGPKQWRAAGHNGGAGQWRAPRRCAGRE